MQLRKKRPKKKERVGDQDEQEDEEGCEQDVPMSNDDHNDVDYVAQKKDVARQKVAKALN